MRSQTGSQARSNETPTTPSAQLRAEPVTTQATTQATTQPGPSGGRGKGPTITLGICLAAGLAAGIALLRPGSGPEPGPELSSTAAPGPVAAASIEISNFSYGSTPSVTPGSIINVDNRDGVAHTLTSSDGAFDTGTIAGNGSAGLVAPQGPGTYSFFCTIHPSMQGSLAVAS